MSFSLEFQSASNFKIFRMAAEASLEALEKLLGRREGIAYGRAFHGAMEN